MHFTDIFLLAEIFTPTTGGIILLVSCLSRKSKSIEGKELSLEP